MNNIAIFASGSGTNAEAIINYFKTKGENPVKIILSNKNNAFVLDRAKKHNIPTMVFDKKQFYDSNLIINTLQNNDISLIILAGFLWLLPNSLIKAYNNKIINIHPSLLPKYGGKGMYGMRVHEAVVANKETESGITIHYVNNEYDKGEIIMQAKCIVEPTDTADMLANKIHKLEYEHFAKAIEGLMF